MRRWTVLALILLLAATFTANAADYVVTVTIDQEGLDYLQRLYPGLDATQLLTKVGEVCSQNLQQNATRDVPDMSEQIEKKYQESTTEERVILRAALKALLEGSP